MSHLLRPQTPSSFVNISQRHVVEARCEISSHLYAMLGTGVTDNGAGRGSNGGSGVGGGGSGGAGKNGASGSGGGGGAAAAGGGNGTGGGSNGGSAVGSSENSIQVLYPPKYKPDRNAVEDYWAIAKQVN